jgi:iron complex transport system permease protein
MTATAQAPTGNLAEGSLTPSTRSGWRWAGLLLAIGVLLLTVAGSLRVGSVGLELGTVVDALVRPDMSLNEHIIVRGLRLPRTLVGVGVGAALAVAGGVMQGLTRNPLADPSILGINAGAAFAVVTAVFLLGVVSPFGYVWFAFGGAAGGAILVYVVASLGRGRATPVRLVLAGAVLTALFTSWITALLVLSQSTLDQVRFWLAGSLSGRDMEIFSIVLPFLLVGVVLALLIGKELNALSLGEDVARSLGQRIGLVRGVGATVVVLLAGGSVAAAGPIGFVGLAVPHIVRAAVGPDYRWILAYCAAVGPILVLVADTLGRVIAPPGEVQVGVITAIVGAPFLIQLARGRRVGGL